MTKIDIFPHNLPKPYFDKMLSMSGRSGHRQQHGVHRRQAKIYKENARKLLRLDQLETWR